MKLELKYKEVFQTVWLALNGVVGGKWEVKPNIWVECPTDLVWRLKKEGEALLIEFPKSKLKVSAAKWVFQLDGTIERVVVRKDGLTVQVTNMPDLLVSFV